MKLDRFLPVGVSAREISRAQRSSGFALIIVVALLALLLMVLVSLATLTRIETGIGANALTGAKARQNARFALDLAVSELQLHAGPDQRSTARSGIVAGAIQTQWTGVWSGGSLQSWLASGNEDRAVGTGDSTPFQDVPVLDASLSVNTTVSIDGDPAVTLIGPKSAGIQPSGYVVARLMDLRGVAPDGTADVLLGRYAWWVGDEGTKARVNLIDRLEPVADEITQRARHRVLQRTGVEAMNQFSAVPVNAAEMPRVLMNNQLSFLTSGAPGPAAVRNRFHDLTTVSRGVMADAAAGGLKKDLSAFLDAGDSAALVAPSGEFVDAGPSPSVRLQEIRNWFQLGVTLGSGGFSERAAVAPSTAGANPQLGLHPVIVRHCQFFGATVDAGSLELRLHYVPLFVLWNPYDVGLAPTDYLIAVDMDFRFEFSGIEVPGGVATYPFNPPDLAANDLEFGPGECVALTVDSTGALVRASSLRLGDHSVSVATGILLSAAPAGTIAFNQIEPSGEDPGTIELRIGGAGGSQLQRVENFPGYAAQLAGAQVNLAGNSWYQEMIAHGWWLEISRDNLWTRIDWAAIALAERAQVETSTGCGYTGPGWTADTGVTHSVFWSIPRIQDAPILSVADFNHLRIPQADDLAGWRPRYFFESGSGYLQDRGIWDRFFLSGFSSANPPDTADPGYAPFFGRLRFLRPEGTPPPVEALVEDSSAAFSAPYDTCAAHVLVDGLFNVNSSSREAWRAVLGSLAGVPVGWSDDSGPSPVVQVDGGAGSPFSRFTFPVAPGLVDAAASGAGSSPAAWGGFRRLTSTQINAMADYFAEHIDDEFGGVDKDAGSPFSSIGDFIGSGIIEDAIAVAAINPGWPGPGSPPNGISIPGVFTKWDFAARLLPVLAVRSDTFTIRAYGETVNPVTQETEARAWCEAVVQRVPDYVNSDPDEPVLDPWDIPVDGTDNMNFDFGRRFIITSFRWLSPDDI